MSMIHFLTVLSLAFVSSLAATLCLERLSHRLGSNRWGMIDFPNHRKAHSRPVPRCGGLVFFLIPILCLSFIPIRLEVGFLVGMAIIFFGGLWDDLSRDATVRLKLVFQFLAVMVFIASYQAEFLGGPGVGSFLLRILLFILVIGIINAANLMDNMNGLLSGIALIIQMTLAWVAYQSGNHSMAVLLVLMTSSILAFHFRNFPKGRIFMGDQGSQLLGYLMATSYLMIIPSQMNDMNRISLIGLALAGGTLLFFPLAYDTYSVIRIRRKEGRPITQGDLCHVSHRLVKAGHSPAGAVLRIHGAQLICAILFLGLIL